MGESASVAPERETASVWDVLQSFIVNSSTERVPSASILDQKAQWKTVIVIRNDLQVINPLIKSHGAHHGFIMKTKLAPRTGLPWLIDAITLRGVMFTSLTCILSFQEKTLAYTGQVGSATFVCRTTAAFQAGIPWHRYAEDTGVPNNCVARFTCVFQMTKNNVNWHYSSCTEFRELPPPLRLARFTTVAVSRPLTLLGIDFLPTVNFRYRYSPITWSLTI